MGFVDVPQAWYRDQLQRRTRAELLWRLRHVDAGSMGILESNGGDGDAAVLRPSLMHKLQRRCRRHAEAPAERSACHISGANSDCEAGDVLLPMPTLHFL